MAEGNEPNPNGNLNYFIDTEIFTISIGTDECGDFYWADRDSTKFNNNTLISATVIGSTNNLSALVYCPISGKVRVLSHAQNITVIVKLVGKAH